jgi:LytS/YehU family sensor histidine kinase
MLLFLNLPFAMVLGWFLAEKERSEEVEAELRERERITRTQALQSQLNPHVLFNVLAGLTELVHEDPDAAERALVGLTDLLRMLLQRGSSLRLPLGQERALLKRYLEIESIRLGGRLKIRWAWDDSLDGLMVPPLLLQPLVENAVRHGISPCPEGGRLQLEARKDGSSLLLSVANTGRPLDAARRNGTGLSNLEERLRLSPELGGSLRLSAQGPWTRAEVRLEGRLAP